MRQTEARRLGDGEASLAGVTMGREQVAHWRKARPICSQRAATTESGRRRSACDGTITIPENA